MTEIGEGADQIPNLKLRKEQASPVETIVIPEQLQRELVGERFFATIETAGQTTIGTGNEQGFVIWL